MADVIIRLSEETARTLSQRLLLADRQAITDMADMLRLARPSRERAPLTKQQHAVLQFIHNFISEHGYAPNFQEIADSCGYKSLGTVHEHVANIERKGYIKRLFNEARGITLLDL